MVDDIGEFSALHALGREVYKQGRPMTLCIISSARFTKKA